MHPVVTTFDVEDPDTIPNKPLAITAILAGPPLLFLDTTIAVSTINSPTPTTDKTDPKNTKGAMVVLSVPTIVPNIPAFVIY